MDDFSGNEELEVDLFRAAAADQEVEAGDAGDATRTGVEEAATIEARGSEIIGDSVLGAAGSEL